MNVSVLDEVPCSEELHFTVAMGTSEDPFDFALVLKEIDSVRNFFEFCEPGLPKRHSLTIFQDIGHSI